MMYIFLIPILIIAIFYFYPSKIKYTDGSAVPSESIIVTLQRIFFPTAPPDVTLKQVTEKYQGKPFKLWLLRENVFFTSPKSIKTIFQDTTTFIKPKNPFSVPLVERILGPNHIVNANGEEWKHQRRSVDPAFYDLSIFSEPFVQVTEKSLDIIEKMGLVPDFQEITQKLTLDILGKTIFDVDFNSLDGGSQEDLKAYNTFFESLFNVKKALGTLIGYKLIPFYKNQELEDSVNHLEKLMLNLIEKSKKKIEKNEKMTSMLDFLVLSTLNGEMKKEDLISNVFIFFLAGHETTATALAFLIQLLALKPEIQEKMRKEVLSEIKDLPTYENTKKLDYMSVVLKENLRLYGPVVQLQRATSKDTILEDVILPKGTIVGINFDAINHSKEIYGDPENFRPERWLNNEFNQNFSWIPFGSGSRICVGNNFSLLEQKIFMSLLLKRFSWEFVEKETKIEVGNSFLRNPIKKTIKFSVLK